MKIHRPGILLVVLLILAMSCAYDELARTRDMDQYHVRFMLYPVGFLIPLDEPPIVRLTFNEQRQIVKRSGGLVPSSYFTGFDYIFMGEVYDELTYGKDVITIQRKEGPSGLDLAYTKYIYFRGDKILRMVVLNPTTEVITYPYYNAAGLIFKTVETTWRNVNGEFVYQNTIVKDLIYEGGNLIRVEGTQTDAINNRTTTLELFSEYDAAPNPTTNLRIFDEVFYRSLSKNNFRKYSLERRNSSGNVFATRNSSWELTYDNDGVPVFY
jgi:hypothetical protein